MKMDSDMALTTRKWEEAYRAMEGRTIDDILVPRSEVEDVIDQIVDAYTGDRCLPLVFAEIGCGIAQYSAQWARTFFCDDVVCVDICGKALLVAEFVMGHFNIPVSSNKLIGADIRALPIGDNYIDIVYTGGTIEHFVEIESALAECYRVLKPGGMVFNTVPYLNIGALTYRQRWGNIPAVPVLRQIAEFVHMRLLGGRHMMFGYEMSYTARRLKRLHEDAGFVNVRVERFPVKLVFEFLPTWAVPCATWLATHCRAFWPMVKVIAYKEQA